MVQNFGDYRDVVNEDALRHHLATRMPPFDTMTVSLLAGGSSNLTLMVRLDDERYVVRRRPLGSSAARAHDMRREFDAISALNQTAFPVPLAHHYSDDVGIVGAPFYVMSYVEGQVLHTVDDVRHMSPDVATRCSELLIDTLAQLHGVDPVQVGLEKFGRPGNFLERRIQSWLRQWNAVEHRDLPAVEILGQHLLERIPHGADTTLVHGDYRLGNVLFRLQPAVQLVSVLDWEMSTIGDPLTDLAHLLVYWETTCGRITHPSQLIAERQGFCDGKTLVERYAARTGRDTGSLRYYLAFEHWRAAIIKDAIYLRAVQRGRLSPEDDALGNSVGLHLAESSQVLAEL